MKRANYKPLLAALPLFVLITDAAYAGKEEALEYLSLKVDKFFPQDKPKLVESYDNPYPPATYDSNTSRPDLYSVAFIYDSALTACVLVSEGAKSGYFDDYTKKAKQICQGIVWHLNHDTSGQKRLRDAYYAWQDLELSSRTIFPNEWAFSRSSLGSMSWAIIALLRYYNQAPDADTQAKSNFLTAAVDIGNFIQSKLYDSKRSGYLHNIDAYNNRANYKSCEQNIDTYVAFMQLYKATGATKWQQRANYAKKFVEKVCWDADSARFFSGSSASNIPNTYNNVADVNSLSVLALGKLGMYRGALEWNYNTLRAIDNGLEGFDFGVNINTEDNWYSPQPDGAWFEGTAQMAAAYQLLGAYGYPGSDYNQLLLTYLERAQARAPNTDGKAMVAASRNYLTTGFSWFYYFSSPSVAATSWYIAASNHHNPLWGISTDTPVPYDDSFSNTAPELQAIGNKIVNRLAWLDFSVKALDRENEKITYYIINKPRDASFSSLTGRFKWKPTRYQAGIYTVTFVAKDSFGNRDSETITITVSNQAPVLDSIGNKSIKAGQTLQFKITANDSDPIDSGKLKYYADGLPRYATLSRTKGTFSWKPKASQRGVYNIRFYAKDLYGAEDSEVVTITVTAV